MSEHDSYAEIAPYYDLEFDSFDADVDLYLGYTQIVGGPVLELGCGTGRLLRPIANTGFAVTGIDTSTAMLEVARARANESSNGANIQLLQGDMRDLTSFEKDEFRLVVIAINSFLHLETRDDQIAALQQIRRVLDRDGLVVIDVFHPSPETLTRMDDRYSFDAEWSTDDGATVQRYSHRQVDSAAQVVTTRLFYDRMNPPGAVTRRTTSYQMRYVHRFELELLLVSAGFELEGVYGSYTLDAIEHDSEHIIAVAHRTPDPGET